MSDSVRVRDIFHDLMPRKIRKILLVCRPYDAFILEQGGSLSSRIASEYHGLNLSNPPRLTRVSSGTDALAHLSKNPFDLVITMPTLDDMDCVALGRNIKQREPDLPVILLAHNVRDIDIIQRQRKGKAIDRFYIWSANPDFLMALVKNIEDHLNARNDTSVAMVRVLLLVEDSPLYLSSFLPLIYKEVVKQTQAVLDESLNGEDRLLKMRARPKILLAGSYEEAEELLRIYEPFLLGVMSDTKFPRHGRLNKIAGIALLRHIRKEIHDLPLLLLSADSENRQQAEKIPAVFQDKNAADLLDGIRNFFLNHLGFGDFVFRLPDGSEVDRAGTFHAFEEKLARIPDDSLLYHARRNHFFNWFMARSEVRLASKLHKKHFHAVPADTLRTRIISTVHEARRLKQQGVVGSFVSHEYDVDIMDFVKIGDGSLGGKALGLAFMARELSRTDLFSRQFPETIVSIPKTLVITTDGFDAFLELNNLHYMRHELHDEPFIIEKFLAGSMPDWLVHELKAFLLRTRVPLSIRSSSILEDAQDRPYAGLYRTYMIPNNSEDLNVRLQHLLDAIRLVYASTFLEGPRSFRQSRYHSDEEGMAVIIQHLAGRHYGDFFYPALSGVALSYNFYPLAKMKASEGIAHIALGFGKTVVEGERCLRFSPAHPQSLPQFSSVDDMLANSQRYFYALRMHNYPLSLNFAANSNLEKREIHEAANESPLQNLTSTYFPEEHRIRDIQAEGPKVVTFAKVLKYDIFPLPQILRHLLTIGRQGMGCDVEIEFCIDLAEDRRPGIFSFLQVRPMAAGMTPAAARIKPEERHRAFCYSTQILGHGINDTIADIIFVRKDVFKREATRQIAREISQLNAKLRQQNRPYLLIGPGRWGSADPWLGIPVQWQDIGGVAAIIELQSSVMKSDPSQGTHFFQNMTALGIKYFTVVDDSDGGAETQQSFFDWQWLYKQPIQQHGHFMGHVQFEAPFIVKIDSRKPLGIMFEKHLHRN